MELASRRESSLQRRAAAAVSAVNAASCADDLMEEMLEEAAGSGNGGSVGALTVEPNTTEPVNSGGMLDALGPVGPPLSFSPGQPPMLVERAKGLQNLEVKQNVENTPGVKRVVVTEQQTGNPPNEGHRTTTEPVQGTVNERSPRDGAGKGKGSGSESGRKNVAAEAQHSTRDVQSSHVRGSDVVVSQDSRMRGFGCENVPQGSHVRGSEGCEIVSQDSRMRGFGCENVSQGSHVRGSESCQNVSQGLTEKGSVVVSETRVQGFKGFT